MPGRLREQLRAAEAKISAGEQDSSSAGDHSAPEPDQVSHSDGQTIAHGALDNHPIAVSNTNV